MRGARIRLKPQPKRQRTREELDAIAAKRKSDYYDRKERQVCVQCEAKLGPDDGIMCERCAGDDSERKQRYARSPKGQRAVKRSRRRFYRACKKRDVCAQCLKPRRKWPPFTPEQLKLQRSKKPPICPDCRRYQTANQARLRALKAAGVASIAAARYKKRRREKYEPLDELLATTRVRVLRGLERFVDFVDVETLFDAIGVAAHDDTDPADRNRFTALLTRLARETDLIERRDAPAMYRALGEIYEYRITDAGRAELRRLLERSRAS